MAFTLSVLCDNNTLIDRYYYSEPGVSYYIEIDDARILFDVGYSDVFLKMQRLCLLIYLPSRILSSPTGTMTTREGSLTSANAIPTRTFLSSAIPIALPPVGQASFMSVHLCRRRCPHTLITSQVAPLSGSPKTACFWEKYQPLMPLSHVTRWARYI